MCFAGSLSQLHPGVDSGLRNGPRSLLTPQCGILIYAMSNSFFSTNTADLARAEEATDGKKSGVVLPSPPLWNGLALLCTATLRYSSLMFQDLRHLSTPSGSRVPFLPLSCAVSRFPILLPSCGVVPVLVFCPAPAALPSLLPVASPSRCRWSRVCLVAFPFDA